MRVMAQMSMVMNLDKCIGCHTCSVTCKQVWTNRDGMEYVRYWSSNVGAGYSEKEVPRPTIAAAIFSRLQTPENLTRIHRAPEVDAYLASLLRKRSSLSEAARKSGI